MFNRRFFLSLAVGSIAAPRLSAAQPASQKVALYANVGADLTHYDVDVASAELVKRATVTLPASVQYAWPHVSRRYLYVATSSSAPGYGAAGTEHHVTAFRIDSESGALTPHGAAIRLPTRPINITTDIPSENILVAFNNPSAVRVYRINKDFTPGEEVTQPGPIDAGIFAHQVRVTPDNRLAILVTRGNEATSTKAEDQDVHVSDGRWQDRPRHRIPCGDAGRADEHQGAPSSEHGPCTSEWPVCVRGEPCRGND